MPYHSLPPVHGPAPPECPLQQPQVTRESATGPTRCLLSIWAQPQDCSLFLEHSSMPPTLHVHGWDGAQVTLTAAATQQVQCKHLCLGPRGLMERAKPHLSPWPQVV